MARIEDVKAQVQQLKQAPREETRWFNFTRIGEQVAGVLTGIEKDVEGQFGKYDVLRLADGHDSIAVRCPSDLRRMIRDNEAALVVGKTHMTIVFAGKVVTGKANPRKLFDVFVK